MSTIDLRTEYFPSYEFNANLQSRSKCLTLAADATALADEARDMATTLSENNFSLIALTLLETLATGVAVLGALTVKAIPGITFWQPLLYAVIGALGVALLISIGIVVSRMFHQRSLIHRAQSLESIAVQANAHGAGLPKWKDNSVGHIRALWYRLFGSSNEITNFGGGVIGGRRVDNDFHPLNSSSLGEPNYVTYSARWNS